MVLKSPFSVVSCGRKEGDEACQLDSDVDNGGAQLASITIALENHVTDPKQITDIPSVDAPSSSDKSVAETQSPETNDIEPNGKRARL